MGPASINTPGFERGRTKTVRLKRIDGGMLVDV